MKPAPRVTSRAFDSEDVGTLAQMIALGSEFIDEQDEAEGKQITVMQDVLTTLADLLTVETMEDEPADEVEDDPGDEPMMAAEAGRRVILPISARIPGVELRRALQGVDAARREGRRRARAPFVDVALRDTTQTGDNSYVIQGHAAVTGVETVLMDAGWLRVRERIAPGAFDRVLAAAPDVHLNIGHDMHYAMARTGIAGVGGLSLTMDPQGLWTDARVSAKLSFVRDLAEQMGSGIIDQMSFAFTIADEARTEREADGVVDVLYEIREIGELYDVCVCAQGAYPQTDSSLRSLEVAIRHGHESESGDRDQPSREARGPETISGDVSGGQVSTRLDVVRLRAKARTARITYQSQEKTR